MHSIDIFRLSLPVFKFPQKIDSTGISRRPVAAKKFQLKMRPQIPISGLLTLFAYRETLTCYSRFYKIARDAHHETSGP
jgi:hypothetical protein